MSRRKLTITLMMKLLHSEFCKVQCASPELYISSRRFAERGRAKNLAYLSVGIRSIALANWGAGGHLPYFTRKCTVFWPNVMKNWTECISTGTKCYETGCVLYKGFFFCQNILGANQISGANDSAKGSNAARISFLPFIFLSLPFLNPVRAP